ncbi:ADP-ribosyltransferase [Elizabethkingia meningoseptica]|uniref:ADP-ribosyltransferase n=1 Tax=Elizabethkingia meningoseptica TaxID=238 RepID=UPI0023B0C5B1|nr:ADP-ribosyltransferase [Elizabethkingia meningoseptica]MDE5492138.1 hypothetical protein [Elizabethkingia meningoseptica]
MNYKESLNDFKIEDKKDTILATSKIIDLETEEYTDLKRLIGNIAYTNKGMRDYQLEFDPKNYISNNQQNTIKDDKGNYIRLKVYRNSKVGNVSVKWNDVRIEQKIDAKNEKIYYRLNFYYIDNTEVAFILETLGYQEFRNLNIFLNYGDVDSYEVDYNYFVKNFADALYRENDGKRLKFIYENIPETILTNISSLIDNNVMFEHLEMLTRYDNEGVFSGWRDGSSAVIQILKAFGNPIPVLNYFRKFPEKLNTIYYNLDGSSQYGGQQQSNKVILGNIILVLSMFADNTKRKQGATMFTIGNGYKINTKLWELGRIFGFGNSDNGTFYLQQQKEEQQRIKIVPKEGDPNATQTVTKDLDEGAQYHPLDMVYLKDISGGIEELYLVPAIYLKALADAESWAVVQHNIRITADVLAVVIGITTLPTGNPYFLLLAIADISLAGADLTIQTFKDELVKYEGGKEFLDTWEKVYTAGGFTIAGLTLVGGFYIGAARLLTKIADGSIKNYIKTLVLKAVLETNISNFQKNTIKVLEPQEIFLGEGYKAMGQELAEHGVVFITGQREGKYQLSYAGIYKGEVILEFNKAELSNIFKDWWRLKGEKMVEVLEWKYDFSILIKIEQFINTYSKVLQEKRHLLKQFINFEEEAVIKYYTTSAYEDLNKFLRGLLNIKNQDKLKEMEAFADALRKSLNKLPDSHYKMFYRSFYMEENQLKTLFKEGGIYEEKAFMSTSFDYDDFLKYWLQENPRHNVIMKIEGKTAKNVEDISDMPEEAEAMFLDGKSFDVIRVRRIPNPLNTSKEIIQITLKEN